MQQEYAVDSRVLLRSTFSASAHMTNRPKSRPRFLIVAVALSAKVILAIQQQSIGQGWKLQTRSQPSVSTINTAALDSSTALDQGSNFLRSRTTGVGTISMAGGSTTWGLQTQRGSN
eukprot:3031847-Amphidinium_carterae.2